MLRAVTLLGLGAAQLQPPDAPSKPGQLRCNSTELALGALPDTSIFPLDGTQLWNGIPSPSQLVPAGHPVLPQLNPCWCVGLVGSTVG